ncbi:hypothetical protein CH333_07065, partial [candidate division WOR-3 bacterium JGI_Cruoil_03_44_89]
EVILDSIRADTQITTGRMLNMMRAVSGYGTIQTMLFLPNDSMFAVSFADSAHNSAEKTPTWYGWNDLFPNHEEGIAEDNSQQHQGRVFLYSDLLEFSKRKEVEIFDILGRKLEQYSIQKISSGIYFMVSEKRVYKLMVIKK